MLSFSTVVDEPRSASMKAIISMSVWSALPVPPMILLLPFIDYDWGISPALKAGDWGFLCALAWKAHPLWNLSGLSLGREDCCCLHELRLEHLERLLCQMDCIILGAVENPLGHFGPPYVWAGAKHNLQAVHLFQILLWRNFCLEHINFSMQHAVTAIPPLGCRS